MASFIAAGYKAPLTAVVFVAETTGGHSYIIPSLIGAACAYAISGEASASGDQRLHEAVRFSGLTGVAVREVMQRQIISAQASATLRDFADSIASAHNHANFPVCERNLPIGTVGAWILSQIPADQWHKMKVGDACDRHIECVAPGCGVMEVLRMLTREDSRQMLFIKSNDGLLEGIVTKTDILRSFQDDVFSLSHNHRRTRRSQ